LFVAVILLVEPLGWGDHRHDVVRRCGPPILGNRHYVRNIVIGARCCR